MEQALQRIRELLSEDNAGSWHQYLPRVADLANAKHVLRAIANSTNVEQVRDHLVEALYALLFAGAGFEVEFMPQNEEGPDLRVRKDGRESYVEVTRFRLVYPGPPEVTLEELEDEDFELAEYGNIIRDVAKAKVKIEGKFGQTDRADSILCVWNDDEDLDENHVRTAVAEIREDVEQGIRRAHQGPMFVLYGSKWLGASRNQCPRQLHCYPLFPSEEGHERAWMLDFERSTTALLIGRALESRGGSSSRGR